MLLPSCVPALRSLKWSHKRSAAQQRALVVRLCLSSTDSAATPLSGGEDTLVVSIAGPPLTGADWDRIFKRLQRNGDAELLRIEFGQINKPVALVRWLCDSWFPQALIGADAATILRGARPVRASVLPTSTSTAAAGTAGTAGTGAGGAAHCAARMGKTYSPI